MSPPLPTVADRTVQFPSYFLSQGGLCVVRRVVTVLSYLHPDITWCPVLIPVTCVMLHYLQEEVKVYQAVANMLTHTGRTEKGERRTYLMDTRLSHEAMNRVFCDLAKRYAKAAYGFLKDSGCDVDSVMSEWIWWIFGALPFEYVVHVMDCYLVEGLKVLYRVGVALLDKWHKQINGAPPSDVRQSIQDFCRNISSHFPVKDILKKAFKIRNLSRKLCSTLHQRHLATLQRKGAPAITIDSPTHTATHGSIALSPVESSILNHAQVCVSVLHYRRSSHNHRQPHPHSHSRVHSPFSCRVEHTESRPGIMPRLMFLWDCIYIERDKDNIDKLKTLQRKDTPAITIDSPTHTATHGSIALSPVESSILNHAQIHQLWCWLPQRFSLYEPRVVYSSSEDGYHLRNLYQKCADNQPLVLVIKTKNDEVFGAFITESLDYTADKNKSRAYFGTGEMFLFSLTPVPVRYPWVGVTDGGDLSPSQSMFISADYTSLVIGGGDGDGIFLDQEMNRGHTKRCKTFNNAPLCISGDFHCVAVEVLGLQQEED
ncbi:GTPase-activating protein skywalker-like [Branchiostoma floridae]|uniref:TBC1 domain family member 24 n=1 Tax=Branchiostoma floridae TaxID=7739 RepID=A0A9J7N8R7_BRAFL|nr:GTPase-activating protein skywalker-like [Branchiostoma floridae]